MKLQEQIDLLGWKDITTDKQIRNGTRIYRLPIKMYGQYIEVGSFESGYVRRMNGGDRIYQLNKCEPCVTYYKDYNSKWVDGEYIQKFTGKYNKYVGKSRIKIMSTKKRLQYLITYCLKNYYINLANQVEDGKYIPKWKHEYEMENLRGRLLEEIDDLQKYQTKLLKRNDGALDNLSVIVNNERYKII